MEKSPAHYWNLDGESDEARLVRLIAVVKRWESEAVIDSSSRHYYQKERARFQAQLDELRAGASPAQKDLHIP